VFGVLVVVLGPTACDSENGTGFLMGTMVIPACTYSNGKPQPFSADGTLNAEWRYFLAEPYDSITPLFPANQISIRMQNISGGWEFSDTLFFWVKDSYEAARCMRGRVNDDGSPDWNPAICDRSPTALGAFGEGRSLVGTEGELVTGHFVPQYSCPDAALSSDALGNCLGGTCPDQILCPGRGSWVAFSRFGAPPVDLTQKLGTDFKVGNGEPIDGTFHVELCDDTTVVDKQKGRFPVTPPAIAGTLNGSFSFHLQPNFR
jgi:hypothetical protein